MATWPENPRLIGTRIPRLDGLAKASGRAKYPSDIRPEGMLFGVMLYSPHAHAKVKSIDTSAAEKMPGVKAVSLIAKAGNDPPLPGRRHRRRRRRDRGAGPRRRPRDQGRVRGPAPRRHRGAGDGRRTLPRSSRAGNVRKGRAQTKGKPEEAMAKADVTIEATYSLPVITHVCLEPHGLTAKWEGDDKIVAWASTQAVQASAGELAEAFSIPTANVTVLTEVMGGGFGSKFGADVWGVDRGRAREEGRPAGRRCSSTGSRSTWPRATAPAPSAKVKLGATKDGKLVAMIAETHGTGGAGGGSNFPLPYVYDVPASSRTHTDVFVNCGGARAMRAPGHPQGCAVMEAAMDDLADKLGIDPLEFRLKNLAHGRLPHADLRGRGRDGGRADRLAARSASRAARTATGPIKRGLGMALHQWGGGGTQRQAGHLHHQPRRLGRAQDRHPGHRHRRPDDPGDHRRRGPRA